MMADHTLHQLVQERQMRLRSSAPRRRRRVPRAGFTALARILRDALGFADPLRRLGDPAR